MDTRIVSTPFRNRLSLLLGCLLLLATSGCSARKLVATQVANTLTSSGTSAITSDNDPQLIEDALPFALKTFESLLEVVPKHKRLLLRTCQSFTQYAVAFIEIDLRRLEIEDYQLYKSQRTRARNMYLRGRDYCLRALDLRHPGLSGKLASDPEPAVAELGEKDVELMFWAGSSWGAAISNGADQAELVADLPAALALLQRCLELDPEFGDGLLQEAMIVIESLPETMGGSPERARAHFDRALDLSGGRRASTYVTWAELQSYAQQNRQEFEEMLEKALAIDPDQNESERLVTLISQKRARILLDLADDLFLE